MKVIAYKKDMVLETNGVCAEGMDIEKLGFIIQAIPLDRIKQAKEEIENEIKMYSDSCLIDNQKVSAITVRRAKVNSYKHCLEILDKLIAESEGINEQKK